MRTCVTRMKVIMSLLVFGVLLTSSALAKPKHNRLQPPHLLLEEWFAEKAPVARAAYAYNTEQWNAYVVACTHYYQKRGLPPLRFCPALRAPRQFCGQNEVSPARLRNINLVIPMMKDGTHPDTIPLLLDLSMTLSRGYEQTRTLASY